MLVTCLKFAGVQLQYTNVGVGTISALRAFKLSSGRNASPGLEQSYWLVGTNNTQ